MKTDEQRIQGQYGEPRLAEKILLALQRSGVDTDSLTREDLVPFEEFHLRGRAATRELARLAEVKENMVVLDIGSGIGGPARTLAAEFGCTVTGVDLSEAFILAAEALTERVGLAEKVVFHHGSALAMPFEDESFDLAWLQHSSMNMEDKPALAREIGRVLRPGGRLALYEICAGPAGAPAYPLPWADDAGLSFLVPPDRLRLVLMENGFEIVIWQDVTASLVEWGRTRLGAGSRHRKAPLGIDLVIGSDHALKTANLLEGMRDNRLHVIQAIADPHSRSV